MTDKEAKRRIEILLKDDCNCSECMKNKEAYRTVLDELEKKDQVIDRMAEQLAGLAIFDKDKDEPLILGNKEEVKQYFEKKVEEK